MSQTRSARDDIADMASVTTFERGHVAGLVGFAVAVTLSLQCLRVLFPIVYTYREESGIARTVFLLVAVFAVPALAPAFARYARPATAFLSGALALGVLRVVLEGVSEITIAWAALASAAGLLTIATGVVVFRHRGAELAAAIVGGLALDTVVRGSWSTWDIAWQHGVLPWVVTVALVVVLVAAAVAARSDAAASRGGLTVAGLVLGAYFALQVGFLQNPAFAASSGEVGLATAVVVVLTGDVLALVALSRVARPRGGTAVALGAAAIAAGFGWLLPGATGLAVLALVVVGQAFATLLLAWTLGAPVVARPRAILRSTLGLASGSLLFGLVVFLYQLHYDQPLPFSNRYLPAVAGAVLACAGLAAPREGRSVESRVPGAGRVAAALGVAAALVFGGLALGEPDLGAASTSLRELRVVTYNPHEAVTRTGQLDPEAFARTVERLRPDVLVVEEAGRGWQLSAGLDLGEWAKRRLGLPYVWSPAADHQFGNLLFSRVPVLDARVVPLPQGGGTMRRSAVIARVGPVAGTVVTVVGTHLQNGTSAPRQQARMAEIEILLRALGDARHVVIAGDLNSDPGSPELHAMLHAGFATVQPSEHCTLKTSNDNCVDWILVTPDLEQRLLRVPAFDTFDHRPVLAVIRPRSER